MGGGQIKGDAARFCTQVLQGDAARGELIPPSRIDVAVPEVLTESQTVGEGEDDLFVRAGLPVTL